MLECIPKDPAGDRTRIRSPAPFGFVLVEVVVVAVIVGILAAVAIPFYSGYVKSQRRDVAKNLAQTAAVTANVHYRRTGADPTSTAQLNLFLSDSSKYAIAISGRYIVVTDISKGDADSVKGAAAFR